MPSRWFWVLLSLLCAGCTPRAAPPISVTPPHTGPAQDGESGSQPRAAATLSEKAAGPLRLGMLAADVLKLPGVTVRRTERIQGGRAVPSLHVSRFGVPLAMADLRNDRVCRLLVLASDYATAADLRVGSGAKDLAKAYGSPRLTTIDGLPAAVFAKASGLTFCFLPTRAARGAAPNWEQVLKQNLRVTAVLVGDPRDQ